MPFLTISPRALTVTDLVIESPSLRDRLAFFAFGAFGAAARRRPELRFPRGAPTWTGSASPPSTETYGIQRFRRRLRAIAANRALARCWAGEPLYRFREPEDRAFLVPFAEFLLRPRERFFNPGRPRFGL